MLFADSCAGCTSKDEHIISLKQQIELLREENKRLTTYVFEKSNEQNELIQYLSGMSKVQQVAAPHEFKSVPRMGGIQQRIARAEQSELKEAEPIVAKRNKEYHERINAILNPETELAAENN